MTNESIKFSYIKMISYIKVRILLIFIIFILIILISTLTSCGFKSMYNLAYNTKTDQNKSQNNNIPIYIDIDYSKTAKQYRKMLYNFEQEVKLRLNHYLTTKSQAQFLIEINNITYNENNIIYDINGNSARYNANSILYFSIKDIQNKEVINSVTELERIKAISNYDNIVSPIKTDFAKIKTQSDLIHNIASQFEIKIINKILNYNYKKGTIQISVSSP